MDDQGRRPFPDADDGLAVLASCPHCGGENAWRLLQTLLRCTFCGSALWWPRKPDQPPFLVAEDVIGTAEAVLDVLRTLDAIRERSRIASLRPDRGGRAEDILVDFSDDPTLPELNELKARRAHLFTLEDHRRVLAPYLLVSSTLVFHALGRSRRVERKEFRNLFFLADEIVPAYPAPWNFRDRGLWVARQRFRPLPAEDLAAAPMKMRDVASDLDALTRRWRTQRLLVEPDLEPIGFDSEVFESSRYWVYRPFHFVRARTPMRNGWFLLDGQFGTVAGYPDDDEIGRVRARSWTRLEADDVRAAMPRAIGFRCPECAADVVLDERGDLQLCENCGRMLAPEAAGLKVVPYGMLERAAVPWWPAGETAATAWLPYWRVETGFQAGGKRFADLAALLREVLPPGGPPAARVPAAWPACWIPAFDAVAVDRYDAWAFEAASALSLAGAEPFDRRFHVDEAVRDDDHVLLPALPWEATRHALPRLLPELLPKPLQGRLNPPVLRKIYAASVDPVSVRLAFAPAPVVAAGETRVVGPSGSVGWAPLRNGVYPPDLQRTVRRWMQRGKERERPETDPGGRPSWGSRT